MAQRSRKTLLYIPNLTEVDSEGGGFHIPEGDYGMTLTAIINDVSNGSITHVGIALTFGLVVLAMIYAVGDISGAHLNPAVTSGFCLSGRFPVSQAILFIAAQCLGAFAASGALRVLFPAHPTLGTTLPSGGPCSPLFWSSF